MPTKARNTSTARKSPYATGSQSNQATIKQRKLWTSPVSELYIGNTLGLRDLHYPSMSLAYIMIFFGITGIHHFARHSFPYTLQYRPFIDYTPLKLSRLDAFALVNQSHWHYYAPESHYELYWISDNLTWLDSHKCVNMFNPMNEEWMPEVNWVRQWA